MSIQRMIAAYQKMAEKMQSAQKMGDSFGVERYRKEMDDISYRLSLLS